MNSRDDTGVVDEVYSWLHSEHNSFTTLKPKDFVKG